MRLRNLVIALLFMACNKQEPAPVLSAPETPGVFVPDTIKPGPYFPVWPGSHWTYVHNDGKEHTDSASKSWVLHQYCFMGGPCRQTIPAFVPLLNNMPVYHYAMLYYYPAPFDFHREYSVLHEKEGQQSLYPPHCTPGQQCTVERRIIEKVKTDQQGDSLIVMRGWYEKLPGGKVDPPYNEYLTYRHFKKNVGLVFHCQVNLATNDTVFRYSLKSWHIAPH